MSAIWKYALDPTDRQVVAMPAGAELLHVGMQDGGIRVWVRVDEDRELQGRIIYIRGTGHTIEDRDGGTHQYVGSAQDGSYVWHVFDGWVADA